MHRNHCRFETRRKLFGLSISPVWLLDPGASTSVLAESHLSAFRSVLQDSEGLGGYRAANGSWVNISGTAEIGVQMHMSGPLGDDLPHLSYRIALLLTFYVGFRKISNDYMLTH